MYDVAAGTLLRRFREGDAAIPAFLDDYAFFVQGLLDLYQVEFDASRIETARRLTETMIALFEDPEAGGFTARVLMAKSANLLQAASSPPPPMSARSSCASRTITMAPSPPATPSPFSTFCAWPA